MPLYCMTTGILFTLIFFLKIVRKDKNKQIDELRSGTVVYKTRRKYGNKYPYVLGLD